MRISDWSSDVCSSDLSKTCVARCCPSFVHPPTSQGESKLVGARGLRAGANALDDRTREFERGLDTDVTCRRGDTHARPARGGKEDRKSVVEGKSVSVRVDLGGRRFIKKKKIKR